MPREDPRRRTSPQSPNEILHDRSIRHAFYLEQLKAGILADVLGVLEERVFARIEARLRAGLEAFSPRGFEARPGPQGRLGLALARAREISREGLRRAREVAEERLDELAEVEEEHHRGLLILAIPTLSAIRRVLGKRLREIVRETDLDGATLAERFDEITVHQVREVGRRVRVGIVQGESADDILRRVHGTEAAGLRDGAWIQTRRQVEAVVRPAVNGVSARVRQEIDQAVPAVIGEQWIATLDTRTCPICMALDGRLFPKNEGIRPPAHLRCRCSTAPVVAGRRARTITYGDWLRDQSVELQDQALGRTRARLFRTGRVDVADFTDPRQAIWRIRELRVREPEVFTAAGLGPAA